MFKLFNNTSRPSSTAHRGHIRRIASKVQSFDVTTVSIFVPRTPSLRPPFFQRWGPYRRGARELQFNWWLCILAGGCGKPIVFRISQLDCFHCSKSISLRESASADNSWEIANRKISFDAAHVLFKSGEMSP